MKKTALLALILATAAGPVTAHQYKAYHHHRGNRHRTDLGSHSHISCATVRSYVARMGLQQARAMAEAAGMTASEERRARRCLADKV